MTLPMREWTNVKADVAIIGGGIAGLTAGISLLRNGLKVALVDEGSTRKAASWINAGTVALQNKVPQIQDICLAAIRVWAELDQNLNGATHYMRAGGYRVACNDDQIEALHQRLVELKSHDVDCEIVNGPEVRKRTPWFSHDVRAASYCPYDGMASPLRTRMALMNAFARSGGLRIASHVQAVESANKTTRLVTSNSHVVEASYVIIAAGAWNTEVSRMFRRPIRTDLKVNILSVTERTSQFMKGSVTTHAGGKFTLKQFANGSCILGGGYSGVGSLENNVADIDIHELQKNLQAQCEVVPGLESLLLVRTWAGFSETAFSFRPVLDSIDDDARVWIILTGDIGFTLGPLFGRMAADAICGHATPRFKNSLRLSENV
ncbi:FAD-binding oxidoreductase [Sinorhizobium meliloti]|uniref:NAD(P)/FAD-dependent oxidoreductase n=1 Tax=Rhizobium meliloti TaxID=382 RepID=UPI0002A59345|nr:FAD-binding oxidoreductase [Sinorhizobium meliloti]AGA08637.1 Glycine/D-amino acid oxidases (deaminating) [Sinorhizobium meliloti GR4]RVK99116.1 FAD-binding oxidoreductase [Sinorhizobium meliloti]RVM89550.1 FAD-binding oxidoreductase [Sinorhizobium meliloti]RVN02263.1 FAD-binding oxidoreductase [Sinorhizobium meliloti]